jgi:hypothetical protein
MNKFFNLIYQFVEEVTKITNQQETIATGVGPTGLATNVAKFIQILNELTVMKSTGTTTVASITTPEITQVVPNLDTQPAQPATENATSTGNNTTETVNGTIDTTTIQTSVDEAYAPINSTDDTIDTNNTNVLD